MKHKDYTDDFLAFWRIFPPQLSNGVWHKPGKRLAFEVWLGMSSDSRAHAMYSVGKYARTVKDGKFVAHARTWLNQCRYEDWDLPEEPGQTLPESMTNILKSVPEEPEVNFNNERNRQIELLRLTDECRKKVRGY